MILAVLALVLLSFLVSYLVTRLMVSLSPRIGFMDTPGGRKAHAGAKPLGGGIGIFCGMALPMIVGLALVHFMPGPPHLDRLVGAGAGKMDAYWSGARQQTPLALAVLGAALAMHLLGLLDDHKAMGAFTKLFVQLAIVAALVFSFSFGSGNLRVLTLLDRLPMGWAISAVLTVLWITAISNAFNFLDNMDGLSAGVGAICTLAFMVAALSIGNSQWFVAAALAMLLGAILGFLWHNFPPARVFMGDSGSLLIGLMLGILTVRTTYVPPGSHWPNTWYALFAPVVVLALPLYDLIVVSIIRMMRGQSPFVGDTNHFSHRLVARGMSRRTAVLCLYLVTAATSVAAIILPHVNSAFAILVFVQTVLILCMVALLEQHPLPGTAKTAELPRPQRQEASSG